MDPTKIYLIMSLVRGIRIDYDPHVLMTGMVKYINELERPYLAVGDEDGVILHDGFDNPILAVMYAKGILKFTSFMEPDEGPDMFAKEAGYMLINVISYLRTLDVTFGPVGIDSIPGTTERSIVHSDEWCL